MNIPKPPLRGHLAEAWETFDEASSNLWLDTTRFARWAFYCGARGLAKILEGDFSRQRLRKTLEEIDSVDTHIMQELNQRYENMTEEQVHAVEAEYAAARALSRTWFSAYDRGKRVPMTDAFVEEAIETEDEPRPKKQLYMCQEAVMLSVIKQEDMQAETFTIRLIEAYKALEDEVMKMPGGRKKVIAIAKPLGPMFTAFATKRKGAGRPIPRTKRGPQPGDGAHAP